MQLKYTFLIVNGVLITVNILLYIIFLNLKKKSKYIQKNIVIIEKIIKWYFYFIGLLILAFIIYDIVLFTQSVTVNRVANCEQSFSDPSYYVTMGDFPLTYTNPYYDREMDLTVADFYWAASRKSYLPCGLRYDKVSLNTLQQVLEKGARLVELDIYPEEARAFDRNPRLVVRNSTIFPDASPLWLDDCFQVIRTTAWGRNEKYPLMLQLNLHLGNNEACYRILRETIVGFFSDRLLDKKYGFCGRYNMFPLGKIPIKETLGKVGIIVNKYPVHEHVDELINATVEENNDFVQQVKYTNKNTKYGGLIATFTDTESLINHNKENIMCVENDEKVNVVNLYKPKDDVENLPFADSHQYGVQWVKMYYNKYDDQMQKYIQFFKQSSLVLKPDALRYIPRPPKVLYEQNKRLSYKPRLLEVPGWYSQKI